jgi:cytoskeleton protein RodZ
MNENVNYPNMTHAAKQSAHVSLGPGAMLRQKREELNKSQLDVAQELHLTEEKIAALESERFDRLPSLLYIRGYLRSYANLLGLPADIVVNKFNQLGMAEKPSQAPKMIAAEKSLQDKPVRWFSYFIMLILVVLVLLWWHHHSINTTQSVSLPSTKKVLPTVPNLEKPVRTVAPKPQQQPSAIDADLEDMLNHIDDEMGFSRAPDNTNSSYQG